MISKFKLMKCPPNNILPIPFPLSLQLLPQIKSIKNPNKALIHFPQSKPQFPPKSITMSSSSSWSCKACTFLNPSSQKLNCQICQTPSPIPQSSSSSSPSKPTLTTTTSSSPHKWACKACTFLNSYSRSNCEICDTRVPSINLDYGDDDFVENSSSSDVGSVFFPLRKCSSSSMTRVSDPNDSKLDLGFRDKVRIQMGTDEFVRKGGDFGGSSSNLPSHKQNEDTINGVITINNKDNGGDVMDPMSEMIVDDTECSVAFKRKRNPSDSFENPIVFNGFRDVKSSKKQTTVLAKGPVSAEIAENGEVKTVSGTIKILSYNVWFRDELEGYLRMQAIGNLIQLHSPDIICFQEVNSVLYAIFQKSSWWKNYRCSVSFERSQNEAYFCMQLAKLPVKSFTCKPFRNTAMRRELCMAHIEVNDNKPLVIATSHLESPCPGPPTWDQMFSKERVDQAKEAITILQQYPNVIFCGDMNWDEKKDGRFPFPEGWFDAWEKLRPAEVGYTYDTKSNAMLTGNRTLQKRLDRFICHLPDFRVSCIDMIGTEPILGLEYKKEKKVRGKNQELTLPVLPSDHFGLLLTVTTV